MEDLVTNPWSGRKVFLTGHTGFKGGWLALWLAHLGATVRGYALDPETQPSFFETARVSSVVEDIRGDLRDRTSLDRALRNFAPDAVFHLAAQPLVRHSYADPVGTYATNVMGSAHLLESLRTLPSVRAAIVVTTDKCYENREWSYAYREIDRLGGHDPYSSSKACVEILCASYRSSFFSSQTSAHPLGLATARAGNVIGGGDWSTDRLVPDLVRGFISGNPVVIRHPNSVRPWQHVLEPIAGYLTLAERLVCGDTACAGAWNFGPAEDDAWPVSRIATAMACRWGDGASWLAAAEDGVHEASNLRLDSSKARTALGWHPQWQIETALDRVLDWYQAWNAGHDMHAFTLAQIDTYQQAIATHASMEPSC